MLRVFVYGTLRAGEANHGLLTGAAFVGRVERQPGLSMVDTGWFPAVYLDPEGSGIVGEVYEIDGAILRRLDGLEGYPGHYDRQQIETPFGSAWIYLYSAAKAARFPLVMGGDWKCA